MSAAVDEAERLTRMTALAEAAALSAVEKTLIAIGIDPTDKLKAQSEFFRMREAAALIAEDDFIKDMAHLRRWRIAMEGVQSRSMTATVGIIVAGLLGALWIGFQNVVGKH